MKKKAFKPTGRFVPQSTPGQTHSKGGLQQQQIPPSAHQVPVSQPCLTCYNLASTSISHLTLQHVQVSGLCKVLIFWIIQQFSVCHGYSDLHFPFFGFRRLLHRCQLQLQQCLCPTVVRDLLVFCTAVSRTGPQLLKYTFKGIPIPAGAYCISMFLLLCETH